MQPKHRKLYLALQAALTVSAGGALLAPTAADAATFTGKATGAWESTNSTAWNETSSPGLPSNTVTTDTVTVDHSGGATITYSGTTGTRTIASVLLGTTFNRNVLNITGGSLTTTGDLNIIFASATKANAVTASGGTLKVQGTLKNDNSVSLSGASATIAPVNFNNTSNGTTTITGGTFGDSTFATATNTGSINVSGGSFGVAATAYTQNAGGSLTVTGAASTSGSATLGTVNLNAGSITVSNSGANAGSLSLNATTTVSSGTTLAVSGGNVTNQSGATLKNSGSTTVSSGTLTNKGSFTNSNITTVSGGTLTNSGTFTNTSSATVSGTGTLSNSGTFNNNSGTFNNSVATATVTNTGTFNNSATLTNAGALNNTGGTLSNSGTVNSTGSLSGGTITNTGTVNVTAGTFGNTTTTVNQNGGTIAVSNGATNSVGTLNIGASGTLALTNAADKISVNSDYTNAHFGAGDSFNRFGTGTQNVTGGGTVGTGSTVGIIAAGNANQGLKINGDTAVAGDRTISFGNVHTGSSNTANFQVANIGTTGPAIRGAIQTGNVTDGRLSGSGVATGGTNYTPNTGVGTGLGTGAATGTYGVNFNPGSTAGSLNSQSVKVVDNFGHAQSLNITGAAYSLASASVLPTAVTLANQHVTAGASLSQSLTVKNTSTDGSFSENLNASVSATPTATASGTISGLASGATDAASLKVGVDATSAGAKSGVATVSLVSTGVGTSGLADTTLGSQTVAVVGNVYNYAEAVLTNHTGVGNLYTGTNTPNDNLPGHSVYTLDFGNLTTGTGTKTSGFQVLSYFAGLSNLTDVLNGSWINASLGSFGFGDNSPFALLNGGDLTSLLNFTIGTASAGSYSGFIDLQWYGSNANIGGGYTGALNDIRLNLVANVIDGTTPELPEPGILWLFGGAGLGWMVSRRKKAVKA